jgi:hypothetical protein
VVDGNWRSKWDWHVAVAGSLVPLFIVFVLVAASTGAISKPTLPMLSHQLQRGAASIEIGFFAPMRMQNDSRSLVTHCILDEPLNAT